MIPPREMSPNEWNGATSGASVREKRVEESFDKNGSVDNRWLGAAAAFSAEPADVDVVETSEPASPSASAPIGPSGVAATNAWPSATPEDCGVADASVERRPPRRRRLFYAAIVVLAIAALVGAILLSMLGNDDDRDFSLSPQPTSLNRAEPIARGTVSRAAVASLDFSEIDRNYGPNCGNQET